MIEIKATEMQNDFGTYFGKAVAGEKVAVSDGDRNAVMLSGREYNELEKIRRNAEYSEKLNNSLRQLAEGKVIVKTMDELEEMAK